MRLLSWILLLVHLNTTLLSPCVHEVDSYDRNGRLLDDINSVVEYVHQIVLGHNDNTPEDEDKGKAPFSTVLKMPVYCLVVCREAAPANAVSAILNFKRSYPLLPDPGVLRRSVDILSPPPDPLIS
jgi:hypothetical protein